MSTSSWLKSVATSGKRVATRALVRTTVAEPTPGTGETVVQAQQMELVAFASVSVATAVTLTGGQRAFDGAAEVGLAANPTRVGFRIRVKSGPAYVGGDDQVSATDGMLYQATESETIYGYTGPVYVADDGTHAVDVRFWEWSTP